MTAQEVLATGWTDAGSLGYPVLFGGVLLGSVVPVVPTGAVVGAAAAVAVTTDHLSLPLVVLLATLAALAGDVVTFTVCRFGGPTAVRWVARGQHAERIEEVREQFRRHGWQIVVVGRRLPAGRIPVLLAAGALAYPWRRLLPASLAAGLVWAFVTGALVVLDSWLSGFALRSWWQPPVAALLLGLLAAGALAYPWRRLLPASLLAAFLWAVAYATLGVVSGGIFDSPLVAVLLATVLVLIVGAVLNVVGPHRRRTPDPEPEPDHSACGPA